MPISSQPPQTQTSMQVCRSECVSKPQRPLTLEESICMSAAGQLKIQRTDMIPYDFFYHGHYSTILILKFSAVFYLQSSHQSDTPRTNCAIYSSYNGRVYVSELHISGMYIWLETCKATQTDALHFCGNLFSLGSLSLSIIRYSSFIHSCIP